MMHSRNRLAVGLLALVAGCASTTGEPSPAERVRVHDDHPFRGRPIEMFAVSVPRDGERMELQLGRTLRSADDAPFVPLQGLGHDSGRDAYVFAASSHDELRQLVGRLHALGLPVPADGGEVVFHEGTSFRPGDRMFAWTWGCGATPVRASTIASWAGGGLFVPNVQDGSWSRWLLVGSLVFVSPEERTHGELHSASFRRLPVPGCELTPRAVVVWTDGMLGVYRDVDATELDVVHRLEVRVTVAGVRARPRHLDWHGSVNDGVDGLRVHLWSLFDEMLAMDEAREILFRLHSGDDRVEFASPGEGDLRGRDSRCANRLLEFVAEFEGATDLVLEVEQ